MLNQTRRIFITGTDTDAGKTLVTCSLIKALQNAGQSVMALKPVAAGSVLEEQQLKNADALHMQQLITPTVDYSSINPIALKAAIAPHIAAEEEGVALSVDSLAKTCTLSSFKQDFLLIEGAGGWLVPLNQTQTYADYAESQNLQVILVVGMKLGCLNHALLTVESIKARGLTLVGWVACSVVDEMQRYQQNLDYLKQAIDAPCLGVIPHIKPSAESQGPQPTSQILQTACSYVNITPLL